MIQKSSPLCPLESPPLLVHLWFCMHFCGVSLCPTLGFAFVGLSVDVRQVSTSKNIAPDVLLGFLWQLIGTRVRQKKTCYND